ncbi:MAG: hypothetical protein ACKVLH_00475 [Bacteroidia bacterium]|jgi:hypothetical protein|tara:strand:- start:2284 stop:5730 length:3447 start_codon:yes stop_codon:yes gene_type:complete
MTTEARAMRGDESRTDIQLNRVKIEEEYFFQITNHDAMRPFFMSVVSDSNHWMFISSNGGLTAGRKNAQYALFPYYTDDKITEAADITGSKSIFQVEKEGKTHLWEPFSDRQDGLYSVARNLYKNTYGNKVLFEEVNNDLGLTFRYQWNNSDIYGFVRKSNLINNTTNDIKVNVLDGIQNILPDSVASDLQNSTSNLVDAYKRSELEESSGLGLFALSAIIVDKAEPSEALKANIAWSLGLDNPTYLLSSLQLKNFRKRMVVTSEIDIKAEKGAYLLSKEITLKAEETKDWIIVADVNQEHSRIAKLIDAINNDKDLVSKLNADIEKGTSQLIEKNAGSDGLQLTADKLRDTRHFSNTLFNIMRGGIFDHNYQIEKWDINNYLEQANKEIFNKNKNVLDSLPDVFTFFELKKAVSEAGDKDFKRLCIEYMPLKFSRRHGDPSRPWNKFSINTRSGHEGTKVLDYEGNWRDIFQNWEALAQSYPAFTESMIHKFLNATTFEGYNPYRVTKNGFDWETVEPDNPWSYIGYWGDHQIIYLLKLLETSEKYYPGKLEKYFTDERFVYANVPYKIKSYQEILENPKDTITFDEELDTQIRKDRLEYGADAGLLHDENERIYKANYIEKILTTVLSKLSNFIPEGGIWMNTQRPEWNDANNALVGNGVSMVTLCYLRRFLLFFENQIENTEEERVALSNELIVFYKRIRTTFEKHQYMLDGGINDSDRRVIMDCLGDAGSDYRKHIYKQSFWGKKRTVSFNGLKRFTSATLKFIDHTIAANKRTDGLYHAYNLMTVENDKEVSISDLSEMLEGQVAILSSGYLSSKEALEVLNSLKASALFREDQYSYILYPNKDLPGFMFKNTIPADQVAKSTVLQKLIKEGDKSVVDQDLKGAVHFNGNFKNANDVKDALDKLSSSEKDTKEVLQIFEGVFNHKAFTGRSGTFFGYEGLGSIYWHMVSKLLLAVQEICLKANEEKESAEVIGKLLEHYYEINAGIGVHKSPELYGAFPTDPYSHTPGGKGAQQPGMTGQVKEDVLSRFGELGVFVKDAKLYFNPCLLKKDEFTIKPRVFNYVDINLQNNKVEMETGSICFTYCQVPVIYTMADSNKLAVSYSDGSIKDFDNLTLDSATSSQIFERIGEVQQITIQLDKSILK